MALPERHVETQHTHTATGLIASLGTMRTSGSDLALIDMSIAVQNLVIAAKDTAVSTVILYSGQADITRSVTVNLKSGQNSITLHGLPALLLRDKLRVEGRGRAFILDVVISETQPTARTSLPDLHPLQRKRSEACDARSSARQARNALSNYLASANANDVEINDLGLLVDEYATLTAKVDNRLLDWNARIQELDKEIEMAKQPEQKRGTQVTIQFVADEDEEIELVLKYAVRNADWSAAYDIRVDTEATKENITMTYKALISQDTGEDWEATSLTLDTIVPYTGIPPSIEPWNLSVGNRPQYRRRRSYSRSRRSISRSRSRERQRQRSTSISPERYSYYRRQPGVGPPMLEPFTAEVTSAKSSISATFQIPGKVNIPSDGLKHCVTIAKVTFSSKVLWYSMPKRDLKTYLTASIRNDSKYAFVDGNANVFVDGSFVATVFVPSVNPQEIFECPLGMDPSVRITYHPREKKASRSGYVSKTLNQLFTQRITVQNTKSVSLNALKIMDNIPVSQDERIQVKLGQPSLPAPAQSASRKPISVGKGFAQWDGADDDTVVDGMVGVDGMLNWMLHIPPMGTVNLVLEFEVSSDPGLAIGGL